MKEKWLDVFSKFKIKNVSGFLKNNLLAVLFTLLICIGMSLSAYFGSDVSDAENVLSTAATHVPSTPTPRLVPDTGWWTTIATPTPGPVLSGSTPSPQPIP